MKLKSIFFVFLAISITTSCSNYLDTQPYSFDTVDKLYTSEEGAELGLTGCYNALNAQSVQSSSWDGSFVAAVPFMMNGGTDELFTRDGFSDSDWSIFGNYTYTSQSEKQDANWCVFFTGINRTNYLLEKIDDINMDESRRIEMKGEAHFLRGLYYLYLSFAYGALPVYTTSDQDATAPRESLENVYNLIISDFTAAYQTLPNTASITGRADKWSAAGFLAKVYTYLASCKLNNVGGDLNFDLNSFSWVDSEEMYKKAKEITDDIINNSGLKLTANYDYLFRETTSDAQEEESLFSLIGSKNSSNGNYNLLIYWQIPIGSTNAGGGYGYMRPTGELYYKYNSTDIRLQHNLTTSVSTNNEQETIDGTAYYIPTALNSPLDAEYCVGKYRYRDPSTKSISAAWSDGDVILLRYADILLLNAEALYYTGDETSARKRLTEVRTRIASDETHLNLLETSYYNQDFVSELLDERTRELCFEGWRRIDLIRFGKIDETISGLSSDKGYWNTIVPVLKSNWKSYKIWFPIPNLEIELSGIEQNPGYN